MRKTMKSFLTKAAVAAALSGSLLIGGVATTPALAQDGKYKTIQELINAVRSGRVSENRENQERERRFAAEKSTQQANLNNANAALANEERRSEQLEAEFKQNDEQIRVLEAQLQDRLGAFGELFGNVRSVAADHKSQLAASMISAQYPGRQEVLSNIATSRDLPSISELKGLWASLLFEAAEQGKVVRFSAPVIGADGEPRETEVVRVGPFTAVTNSGFLTYKSPNATDDVNADGKLTELPRQPSRDYVGGARAVFNNDSGFVRGSIDPSSGGLLRAFVDVPTLQERIQSGGVVGYAILVVLAIGLVLSVLRIFSLYGVNGAVRSQARRPDNPRKGNPLGRVLMAYEENRNADVETLELKLDEAIVKELPRLESGLATLKLLAAIAPLMGLLGTVIGMIQTFQTIQLFGTGDPKLMAGGISLALVTTVMGLVTAIPLLLLHSIANGLSKSVTQTLEEQAAGLVAARAEGR